jgi:L-asparagine oxygenase
MNELQSEWIDYRTATPPQFTRHAVRPLPARNRLRLGAAESDALLQAAVECPRNPYVTAEVEDFIQLAQQAGRECFCPGTRQAAAEILESGFGALLLENVPADAGLPPTPLVGGALEHGYKETFVTEFAAVAIGALVDAQLFNFRQEGGGSATLFDNVVPVRELRERRGAGGFDNNFPFHCESSWHRMRPDYVVLLGVKEDPQAMTLVSSITEMLDQQLVASMPAGSYRMKPPELYSQMAEEDIPLGTPLYCMTPPVRVGEPASLNVNFNGTDCLGPAAVEWLARLERSAEENAASVVLGSGNAIVLNNNRTCHTRTGYSPDFSQDLRWFLRINLKRDLWSHALRHDEAEISGSDMELMGAQGWVDPQGNLTESFLPFVENPRKIRDVPVEQRSLVAKALHLTPVTGSRIV